MAWATVRTSMPRSAKKGGIVIARNTRHCTDPAAHLRVQGARRKTGRDHAAQRRYGRDLTRVRAEQPQQRAQRDDIYYSGEGTKVHACVEFGTAIRPSYHLTLLAKVLNAFDRHHVMAARLGGPVSMLAAVSPRIR